MKKILKSHPPTPDSESNPGSVQKLLRLITLKASSVGSNKGAVQYLQNYPLAFPHNRPLALSVA